MNNSLLNFYQDVCDEDSRLNANRSASIEYLTTMKYIQKICCKSSRVLDACAGTGVYAFPLALEGYKVTAGDFVPYSVKKIEQRQKKNPVLERVYTGSILDLSQFEDESFDVVLNLGSYYHLQDEKDRINSIRESLRVLKSDGIYFLSYLNRHANFAKYHYQMKDDIDRFMEYIENGYNGKNDLFYGSTPEEVEDLMVNKIGIKQRHNIATDGLKFVVGETIDSLDDKQFAIWMDNHYRFCEQRSLLGYSEHGLFIGKK